MTTLTGILKWGATIWLTTSLATAITLRIIARNLYKPTPVPPRRPTPDPARSECQTRPPHHHPHPSTRGAGAGHLTPQQHAILDQLDAEFDDLLTILDRTSDDDCPPHGLQRPDTPESK